MIAKLVAAGPLKISLCHRHVVLLSARSLHDSQFNIFKFESNLPESKFEAESTDRLFDFLPQSFSQFEPTIGLTKLGLI